MVPVDILSDEFARLAAEAGLRARERALAAGHPVVFVDEKGRYIQELPNGRRLLIRFEPGKPRDSHIVVLGEAD